MERIPRNSVGLAGEFAALAQLTLRGYDAGMTLGHTKNIDILVFDPVRQKRYEVEVKTNLEARNGPSQSKLFGRFVTDWQGAPTGLSSLPTKNSEKLSFLPPFQGLDIL